MIAWLAIIAGAAVLAWPALLNGYPLVFIDSVSYLGHTLFPEWPWDKTAAYGPFLHLFHWGWSLWPALAGQVLILSHLLWVTQRAMRGDVTAVGHILLCGALAGLTSAAWFAATLMPDIFAAVGPLCLLLIAFARERLTRPELAWLTLLGAFAVATHLSHLPTALVLVAFAAFVTRRFAPPLRAALPVAIAVVVLVAANAWAFGKPSLSPHGAAFLLARLQADGPATQTLREQCPRAGWALCAQLQRLPMDSDRFLWDSDSPLNRAADGRPIAMGAMRMAPEASAIVGATILDHPVEVVVAMARNTLAQLERFEVGDTLGSTHLSASARRAVEDLPPDELAAFDAAAQMQGRLPDLAAPFVAAHLPMLVLSLPLLLVALGLAAWRGDRVRLRVLAGMVVAVGVNAFVTGALSGPAARYQARIVWLLPLGAILGLAPRFGSGLTDEERIRARMTTWPTSSPSSSSS
ncbi:hypothetical protein GWK16_21745 [Roseomonas sp. JC162]|uniref:Uncharacterized protein n=1 Tax=Neoroseomonas marina TaxID=1232220 RepID=A0A848EIS1_9PROT|nr:hypothetical protein [Neoroseomonas marina]NMJ43886.1 hypothetical protein [Neoroseomonas marina]